MEHHQLLRRPFPLRIFNLHRRLLFLYRDQNRAQSQWLTGENVFYGGERLICKGGGNGARPRGYRINLS